MESMWVKQKSLFCIVSKSFISSTIIIMPPTVGTIAVIFTAWHVMVPSSWLFTSLYSPSSTAFISDGTKSGSNAVITVLSPTI